MNKSNKLSLCVCACICGLLCFHARSIAPLSQPEEKKASEDGEIEEIKRKILETPTKKDELMSGRQISVSSLFIFKVFLLFVHLFAFGQRCFALSCAKLFFSPSPFVRPRMWAFSLKTLSSGLLLCSSYFFPACCSEFPNRFCGLFVNYLYL